MNKIAAMASSARSLSSALLMSSALLASSLGFGESPSPNRHQPAYTGDGRLIPPENYREWVYLSSGFDMSYGAVAMPGQHLFDNVFVEPTAYRSFLETGTWPDKTMLMLEIRGAKGKGSINTHGNYQGTDIVGLEMHIKDTTRFPGQWAFFALAGKAPAIMLPQAAECYSCHAAHAAVDTTFVQFYPTLLPIAEAKKTTSEAYQHDLNTQAKLTDDNSASPSLLRTHRAEYIHRGEVSVQHGKLVGLVLKLDQ